ncbi:MAG: GNAT family N-acetyltransferase [Pseudomonadota bacterium]
MPSRLQITPLLPHHLDDLALAIRKPEVYEFIEREVPSHERFCDGLARALAGPQQPGEVWLNHLVRLADTGRVIGRLEATLHHGIAEVAFLFDPAVWGQGYATEGLCWLHERLMNEEAAPSAFWATTVPQNLRCQALLERCGYQRTAQDWPLPLLSYDEGDLVYRRGV